MDELKKLLRRLDGIDTDKGTKTQQAEQRGYVGALRGAPAEAGAEVAISFARPVAQPKSKAPSSKMSPLAAAAAAAMVSTVTVFLLLSWQEQQRSQSPRIGKSEARQPGGSGQMPSAETQDGLVRQAELLMQRGEFEGARTLLQRAAEFGSGSAALKLGQSYDPSQTRSLTFADSGTNPALAKAWYERALALGSQEAAGYLAQSGR
jgi:hypothetical protein